MAYTIATNSVTSINTTTAVCGGNSISGSGVISAKGVCWSTSVNPTVALATKTNDGTSSANFTSNITGLIKGTTYYVRAYVTDGSGTYYGSNIVFTTLGITLSSPTSITGNSATLLATDINGFTSISAVGFCWQPTNVDPDINDNKTTSVLIGNSFTSNINGLTPGTLYYVRAYVTSGGITYYSSNVVLNTTSLSPSVGYTSISAINSNSSSITGYIINNNGSSITSRGVRYSEDPLFGTFVDQVSVAATSPFTSNLTGLSPATTYYYKLYGTNSIGTGFTSVYNFTTLGGPIVETVIPYAITSQTVQSGCNILSEGGSSITARGIVISTTSGPTLGLSTVYNSSSVFDCAYPYISFYGNMLT
jgi:hypothetical protein